MKFFDNETGLIIMNNIKAEKYLYKRLELMYSEKAMLVTKLDKIQLEIDEIDTRVEELLQAVDTAMEVFSPQPKKNDFIKTEIENLKSQKDKLKEHFTEFSKQSFFVEENIKELQDILEESSEEVIEESSDEIVEESCDEVAEESCEKVAEESCEEIIEGTCEEIAEETLAEDNEDSADEIESIELVVSEETLEDIQILEQRENERTRIAKNLYESIIRELTSLANRCEMCTKIMEVDSIRAKLEIENMTKILVKLIEELRKGLVEL